MKPDVTLKPGPSIGNIVKPSGYDMSMFQTFKKDPKKRKRNKLSRKSRKNNR